MTRTAIEQDTISTELSALVTLVHNSGREIDSTITGLSMSETLPPGTSIRILCHTVDQLAVGDIVAFVKDDTLVAHRLVQHSTRHSRLLTRGDSTVICDLPVPYTAVLGQVTAANQGGTWLPAKDAPRQRGGRRLLRDGISALTKGALFVGPGTSTAVTRIARGLRRAKHRFTGRGWSRHKRRAQGS